MRLRSDSQPDLSADPATATAGTWSGPLKRARLSLFAGQEHRFDLVRWPQCDGCTLLVAGLARAAPCRAPRQAGANGEHLRGAPVNQGPAWRSSTRRSPALTR